MEGAPHAVRLCLLRAPKGLRAAILWADSATRAPHAPAATEKGAARKGRPGKILKAGSLFQQGQFAGGKGILADQPGEVDAARTWVALTIAPIPDDGMLARSVNARGQPRELASA